MRFTKKIICFLLASAGSLTVIANPVPKENNDVQMLIHLLEYISVDYPSAIKDGRIISREEFAEMKEFSTKAGNLAEKLKGSYASDPAFDNVAKLKTLIENKASHS